MVGPAADGEAPDGALRGGGGRVGRRRPHHPARRPVRSVYDRWQGPQDRSISARQPARSWTALPVLDADQNLRPSHRALVPTATLAKVIEKAVKHALGDGPRCDGARMFLLKVLGADQIRVYLNSRSKMRRGRNVQVRKVTKSCERTQSMYSRESYSILEWIKALLIIFIVCPTVILAVGLCLR